MPRMHRDRLRGGARLRVWVQLAAACFLNGYAAGFLRRSLYTGKGKLLCVPVLNCYSCPGALGACPIGAMQTVAAGKPRSFSFYALGTLMLFGVIFGRLLCGWICPFGFVQDLLQKLPVKKRELPHKTDRALRYLKYAVLVLLVLVLPAAAQNDFGTGEPWFCKYLCPAGTLEGGVPQLLLNADLRALAGGLFTWKLAVMLAILAAAVVIPRCFCRYLCPLGALYALMQRFSFYQMTLSREKCVDCGKCSKVCPMAVQPTEELCSGECIRCGKCRTVCPTGAIIAGFRLPEQSETDTLPESSRKEMKNL